MCLPAGRMDIFLRTGMRIRQIGSKLTVRKKAKTKQLSEYYYYSFLSSSSTPESDCSTESDSVKNSDADQAKRAKHDRQKKSGYVALLLRAIVHLPKL